MMTSPDITQPLSTERQFKNLNKVLKIKTEKENIEGTLVDLNEEGIHYNGKLESLSLSEKEK